MSHNVESLLDSSSKAGIGYGIEQFAKGLVHTGIESPVNAILQVGSKAIQSEHVPKLQLTGAPDTGSLAGMAGSMTGAAIDFYLLHKAAAPAFEKIGLSGISTGAQVGRMALTGAVYEGLLLESDPNSKNFFGDRLKAATVGACTFAVMGATAAGVDKLGIFAVPEARTLLASVGHGALTGSIAGVARAEINSIVKEQRFASASELLTDTFQYGTFGAVFGGLSYAQNAYANAMRQKLDPRPVSFQADDSHKVLDIKRDANGKVVKAVIERPAYEDRSYTIHETLSKMTDGTWSTSAKFAREMRKARWWVDGLSVNQTADGTLAILRDGKPFGSGYDNYVSVFKPNNQGFQNLYVDKPGFDPSLVKYNGANVIMDNAGYREYKNNNLQKLVQKDGQAASVTYKADGTVEEIRLSDGAKNSQMVIRPEKNGSWQVAHDNYTYNWNGKINLKSDAGNRGFVEFKNPDGSVHQLKPDVQIKNLTDLLKYKMTLADGPTHLPVVNVDKSGKIVMTESTRMYRPIVNDEPIKNVSQEIKPGDKIILWEDIGDRGPDVVGRILQWGKTPSGVPTLDGKTLQPGSRHQFLMPTSENHVLTDGQFYRRYRLGIKGEF
jgi:hypothetical protein